jgi:ADP-ribose pyrophosphatase
MTIAIPAEPVTDPRLADWREVWRADDFDLAVEWCPVPGGTRHRITAMGGRPGAVAVPVDEAGRVLVIRHERPAADRVFWELPRGFADPSDPGPLATGLRELVEETGAHVRSATELGRIWPDTGLLAGSVGVVAADCGRADVRAGDGEALDPRWLTPAGLDEAIMMGLVRDGITLAALALWRVRTGSPRWVR